MQGSVRASRKSLTTYVCWLSAFGLALLLAGCAAPSNQSNADNKAAASSKPPLPVLVPFDLARAGATASADFYVPDVRTSANTLEPVFIGVRSVSPRLPPGADPTKGQAEMRYLDDQEIPIRIHVWRLEGQERIPVRLTRKDDKEVDGMRRYVPVQDDKVNRVRPANSNWTELEAIGRQISDGEYELTYEIAGVGDLVVGQYQVEVVSLESHPILTPMKFELLISHFADSK